MNVILMLCLHFDDRNTPETPIHLFTSTSQTTATCTLFGLLESTAVDYLRRRIANKLWQGNVLHTRACNGEQIR
jgi:predicted alpha/beta-fold hydrolase